MASASVVTSNYEQHLSTSNGDNGPTTYLLLSAAPIKTEPIAASRPVSNIAPKRSQRLDQLNNENFGSEQQQNSSLLRTKRKIGFNGGEKKQHGGPAPPAVARRNERERNRVRQVNLGFATLRQHVPNGAKSKKMSKVETLRSAVQYIKQLQQLLNETGQTDDENSLPSFEETANRQTHLHYGQTDSYGPMSVQTMSPQCSAASSPTPSLGSDASSPYDSLSPEDEDLLDFTTWLS